MDPPFVPTPFTDYFLLYSSICVLLMTEDQQAVHIHLEKLNTQQWWENVLTHHPKINTRKIEPGNGKLSDLDGETR
jgi:hypothetical protein